MTEPSQIMLTPTARLARNLARELAAGMAARGQTAWLRPQVYSFSAWLSQLCDDYFLDAEDERVPINAQQALVLWQSLINTDVFIGEPQVADLAQRSWRMIHEHDLTAPEQWPDLLLSADSRRFKDWATSYRVACAEQGLVDEWAFAAEIPQLVTEGKIRVPGTIELVGFDLPATPIERNILAALEAAGTNIKQRETRPRRLTPPDLFQFEQPDDELFGAALWARERLENDPLQSIAVVVPDLGGRVDRVERLFRQVFDPPGFALEESAAEPWHISLGNPLAEWSLVTHALAVLALPDHRLNQPQAARLLRSPYLPGWYDEGSARNQTLAHLARKAPYDLTINELQWALKQSGANQLAERLAEWQTVRHESTKFAWPSEWVGYFEAELASLGFCSGRKLDSREYQVLLRWHDLLEAFSALDLVVDAPLPRRQALSMLTERARSTVFRERNPGAPVEVLGVEETLGSQFDALWITTLDSDTWPGPTQHDPLIPVAVQATVPSATSDGCLEQAQRELNGLLASAPITRGSFARGNDETAIRVTALLPDCALQSIDSKAMPEPAVMATPCADDQAPALEGSHVKGGTGVLREQSSCPFRAFAERRLHAIDLTPPRPGLDPGQRGSVIHKALEQFWKDLKGSAELAALNKEDQQQRIRAAVDSALDAFTERFRLTLTATGRLREARRAARLLCRWLEVERQRDDFTVIAHEHEIRLDLAGLMLTGKIDRLDRLADGSTLLIDYKTGHAGSSDWFPQPRIADPQLPAYAVSIDPNPSAIAFARLRPDDLRFDGLAEADIGTPGVTELASARYKFKAFDSWSELLKDWQTQLETLARDFDAGKAAVDPSRTSVCKTCHLHALCRIQERAPYDSSIGENADE